MSQILLRPSSAETWIRCHASIPRCAEVPDTPSSPAAQWGTDAHAILQTALTLGVSPFSVVNSDDSEEVEKATHAKAVCDYIKGREEKMGSARVFPELKVAIEEPYCQGTTDVGLIFGRDILEVEAIDLKTGRIPVFADSLQLRLYLLGVRNVLTAAIPSSTRYRATIVQSRLHTVDSKVFTNDELDEFWDEQVAPVIQMIKENKFPDIATPGEKQCKWCKVRGNCKEAAEWAARVTNAAKLDAERGLPNLSDDELAYYVSFQGTVKEVFDKIKEETKQRMQQGGSVPGFKLTETRGALVWEKEYAKVSTALRRFRLKKAQYTPQDTLLTPTQLLKNPDLTEEQREKIQSLCTRGESSWRLLQTSPNSKEIAK